MSTRPAPSFDFNKFRAIGTIDRNLASLRAAAIRLGYMEVPGYDCYTNQDHCTHTPRCTKTHNVGRHGREFHYCVVGHVEVQGLKPSFRDYAVTLTVVDQTGLYPFILPLDKCREGTVLYGCADFMTEPDHVRENKTPGPCLAIGQCWPSGTTFLGAKELYESAAKQYETTQSRGTLDWHIFRLVHDVWERWSQQAAADAAKLPARCTHCDGSGLIQPGQKPARKRARK